ncbi:hypothetical protein DPMN_188697 [Dreissena polymorpha]|uniref:Trafficking kinesin-binding protein C-terminal domain-containing protein n=1 Tax=Dreissena polymorpha TaxID=45954 RepID=A0A9D4DU93_DREPO|nr:hypothetical protein DPMN_188697 [Dreissena polymorpha]
MTRVNSDVMERSDTESTTPGRCPSPDSQVSANSGYLSMTGSGHYYKMPEKLRIVKPLEGYTSLYLSNCVNLGLNECALQMVTRFAQAHQGQYFQLRLDCHLQIKKVH